MPRYVFAVRHFAYADLQDDAAGMELPDDAAAREFAAKVMRGLVRHQEEDWEGWPCTIAGRKTSWRLARSAWLAIRLGPPPRTRSTICVARPWRSRRWLPI